LSEERAIGATFSRGGQKPYIKGNKKESSKASGGETGKSYNLVVKGKEGYS